MVAFARAKRIDKVIDLFEDTMSNVAAANPYRRADEEDPRTSIPRYPFARSSNLSCQPCSLHHHLGSIVRFPDFWRGVVCVLQLLFSTGSVVGRERTV